MLNLFEYGIFNLPQYMNTNKLDISFLLRKNVTGANFILVWVEHQKRFYNLEAFVHFQQLYIFIE